MKIDDVIKELKRDEKSMRFARLKAICEHFFGAPRIKGGHHIFSTGLADQPLVNIQNDRGQAKDYQVRQVRQALEKKKQQAVEKSDG